MKNSKIKDTIRLLVSSFLIVLMFFLALEAIQRVRWYFKSDGSSFWLFYGFTQSPTDYAEQLSRITEKKKFKKEDVSSKKVYKIQIFEKTFLSGIKKHNPDYPDNKGQVNSLGFRSGEFIPAKPPDVYRIIASGASSTAGYESDVAHTWPAELEKKLNSIAMGGKKIEVINAGKGAEAMSYVNNLLEKELVYYEPDMAMVYLTFNHLHVERGAIRVPRDFHYKIHKLKAWLSSKSLFFLTLREKLNILFHTEGYTLGDIYVSARNSEVLAKGFLNAPEIFTRYEKYLQNFVDICNTHDITPVLITEACVLEDKTHLLMGKEMDVVFKRMYGIMEEVARENGAVFIDAAESMNNIPNKNELFVDGLHLHPKGNDALANIIYLDLKSVIAKQIEEEKL